MFNNEIDVFTRTVLTETTTTEDAMCKVFCEVYNASYGDEELLPDVNSILSVHEKNQMTKNLVENGASMAAAEALVDSVAQLATMTNITSGIFAPEEFGLSQGVFLQGDEAMPGIVYSLEFGAENDAWVSVEATATVLSDSGVFDEDTIREAHDVLKISGAGVSSTSSRVPQETLELAQELLDMMKTDYSYNIYGRSSVEGTPFMGTEMLTIIGKCFVHFSVRFIFDQKDVEIITNIPHSAAPHGRH